MTHFLVDPVPSSTTLWSCTRPWPRQFTLKSRPTRNWVVQITLKSITYHKITKSNPRSIKKWSRRQTSSGINWHNFLLSMFPSRFHFYLSFSHPILKSAARPFSSLSRPFSWCTLLVRSQQLLSSPPFCDWIKVQRPDSVSSSHLLDAWTRTITTMLLTTHQI